MADGSPGTCKAQREVEGGDRNEAGPFDKFARAASLGKKKFGVDHLHRNTVRTGG